MESKQRKRRVSGRSEDDCLKDSKRSQVSISDINTLTMLTINRSIPRKRAHPLRQSNHKCSRRNSRLVTCERKWVYSSTDFSACKDTLMVVSYNILGVENAWKNPELYFSVRPKDLAWDHRKVTILKEIRHYNADILCFQEVDRFEDLEVSLKNCGYKGIFKGRTGDASDGCAIFWKGNEFTLVHEEMIEFQSFGLRNNITQLCILRTPHCHDRCILIGNIHVLFNPKRGDIKLGQVRVLLEKAYKLSRDWGNLPVIICGDLNSLPQSALYEFVASSKLDLRSHDRRSISGQMQHENSRPAFRFIRSESTWTEEQLRLATGNGRNIIEHKLNLQSAYPYVPGGQSTRDRCGEPLATSHNFKFTGTVDYIWHTKELAPVRVLETLPLEVLRSSSFPNKKYGSDHLAIACELAFVDNTEKT